MHYILSLFHNSLQRKNIRLFIVIFISVFIVVAYVGKTLIDEFDRIKEGFLENLSQVINKKIQIGPFSGDYLYNVTLKKVSLLNKSDNTLYVKIPSIDVEYNALRIILDSKNGLNYIKTVTLNNFDIFLREGFLAGINTGGRTTQSTTTQVSPIKKLQLLSIILKNGRIHKRFWSGQTLLIKNINGKISKTDDEYKVKISGKLVFTDKQKKLSSDISIYFYKTDSDNFIAGTIILRNIKYGVFYVKETLIGIKIDENGLNFTTLNRNRSSKMLEGLHRQIFEPNLRYDKIPNFSGSYNFNSQKLKVNLKLHSSPYTTNKLYQYFIRPKVKPLFKYGFFPYGEANLEYNGKKSSLNYSLYLSASNFIMRRDRISLHISGNSQKISFNSIKYTSTEGIVSGTGIFNFKSLVPTLNLYAEDFRLPIGQGIQISSFIRTKQTSTNSFDLVFEDIEAVSYYKSILKISFTLSNNAIMISSNSIINDKLKLTITIPKIGSNINAKLEFLDIPIKDVQHAINPIFTAERVTENIDQDTYIIRGIINAKLFKSRGKLDYSIDGDIKILNEELTYKYLVKTIFSIKNNIIQFDKLNFLNGDALLKGKIKFDGNYIFPEFSGNYKFWEINLNARIIRGPITRIEGMLNHSLNFHGIMKQGKLTMNFDLDDFVFKIGRKPIMLSDSFTLVFEDGGKKISGGGTVIWHNIDILAGKKTGVYVRFTQHNNVLKAHEVVFFSDFSSKKPLNLEQGNPGYGKVWIEPVFGRLIVEAHEIENRWWAKVDYGMSSDMLNITVNFLKPYDFSRIDNDFYAKFIPTIKRAKIASGKIQALGTSTDISMKAYLKLQDCRWKNLVFSADAQFSMQNDIVSFKKLKLYNRKGNITLSNVVIAMNDTWQLDFDGIFDLNFLNNQLEGELNFRSSNINNNNQVTLAINKLKINKRKFKNINLKLLAKNMRFHDMDQDKWALKVLSTNSNNFIGMLNRNKNKVKIDLTYFLNDIAFTSLEGNIENNVLDLHFYSTPFNLSFLNYLSTGLKNIKGQIKYSFNLKGRLREPELFGYLKIVNGSFYANGFSNKFSNLNTNLTFKRQRLDIDYFNLNNSGTSIIANGFIDLKNWKKPNILLNLKTKNNNTLDINYTTGMMNTSGKLSFNLTLRGERGRNKLSGNIGISDNIITITPIDLRIDRSSRRIARRIKQTSIIDTLGLDLKLFVGPGVDLVLNPEVFRMRLLKGGNLRITRASGYRKELNITGILESRKGILRAYNSTFNIYYAKIDFKNEIAVLRREGVTQRRKQILLTLNSRSTIHDEMNERLDIYLDYNGEINKDLLKNFNKHLVLRIPTGRSKKEVFAILGKEGEGLSFLLSPILNVFKDQLGFIDRIGGRTQAFQNISRRRSVVGNTSDSYSQGNYRRLNAFHNTEISVGKYINVFGLFNNNLYLNYSLIFKQNPIGNDISGFHKVGLNWTIYNWDTGDIQLSTGYSPYLMGAEYKYQPTGSFVTNIRF